MIHEEKQILRERMKALLGAFATKKEASRHLREHLFSSRIWQGARVVYGFSPMSSEPDWLGPDPPSDRLLAFPRISGDQIDFFVAEGFAPGKFGIREPLGSQLAPPPDVVLVPGLAFGASGARLGRGGGFYDRWLARHPAVITVGLCFACQLVEHLPGEAHDLQVRSVLTELGFARPR